MRKTDVRHHMRKTKKKMVPVRHHKRSCKDKNYGAAIDLQTNYVVTPGLFGPKIQQTYYPQRMRVEASMGEIAGIAKLLAATPSDDIRLAPEKKPVRFSKGFRDYLMEEKGLGIGDKFTPTQAREWYDEYHHKQKKSFGSFPWWMPRHMEKKYEEDKDKQNIFEGGFKELMASDPSVGIFGMDVDDAEKELIKDKESFYTMSPDVAERKIKEVADDIRKEFEEQNRLESKWREEEMEAEKRRKRK